MDAAVVSFVLGDSTPGFTLRQYVNPECWAAERAVEAVERVRVHTGAATGSICKSRATRAVKLPVNFSRTPPGARTPNPRIKSSRRGNSDVFTDGQKCR